MPLVTGAAESEPIFPRIVAHRGASHEAPENTLAAFRLALAQDADAIEGDFRLTRDGRVVCLHDDNLRRTGGGINRLVADSTLDELREFDVGQWKGPQWKGERIPVLEEVLDLLPPGRSLFLEIKSGPSLVPHIQAILKARAVAPGQIVIIAFDPAVIEAAKREMPEFAANLLVGFFKEESTGRWRPSAQEAVKTAVHCRADGVSVADHPAVNEAFVAHLRAAGLAVHVWTVNEAGAALRHAGWGAQSLTTDRPGPLRAELRKLQPRRPDSSP